MPRRVPKGEKVFKEGDKADFFYIVASGVVRTYTVLSDGRRIIDDFHFADDILGLDPGAQHRFSAASVCDSVVSSFRRSDLDRVLECDKELGRRVQSSLLVSLGRAQDHVVLMGLRTAREKIEAFLGTMAERASRGRTPKLRIQQSDIADHLGLSRETVSRALSLMVSNRYSGKRPSAPLGPGDRPKGAFGAATPAASLHHRPSEKI
jgi:CRP/FNR family nitrogen fixation transcriptional regulator